MKSRERIYKLITQERQSQETKHAGHTCASNFMSLPDKYLILSEEALEIARSINDGDYRNLREELVQVAAVCVAWLESLTPSEEHPSYYVEMPT